MTVQTLTPVNSPNLKDKAVLITGGASGLGRHAAICFAEAGAHVTVADIQDASQLAAESTARGLRLQFIQCDVTSWDSQAKAFKSAVDFTPKKSLDIVAAFAGVDDSGHLVDHVQTMQASSDSTLPPPSIAPLEVNTKGAFYTAALALHHLRRQSHGSEWSPDSQRTTSLTIISSMAGYIDDTHDTIYTASKFGSRGLFRAIRGRARDGLNVRVNLIAPWAIKTPMTAPFLPILKDSGIEEGRGITFAAEDDLTQALMRIAVDENISGKPPPLVCLLQLIHHLNQTS